MDQLSRRRLAGQQEHLDAGSPVRGQFLGALVDFHVAPDDGPAAPADPGKPVFVSCALRGLPGSEELGRRMSYVTKAD